MPLPKFKRDAAPPAFDRRGRRAIRLASTLAPVCEGYEVRFGRERWERPYDFFEDGYDGLRWRRTQASILQDGRQVGALEFVEYETGMISHQEFFDAMDAESFEMMRVASVLLSQWGSGLTDVLEYGRVLEVTWVWMEPAHPRTGVWVQVLDALIGRVERSVALITALAYPLEYENRLPANAPERAAFERRRRAMFRYYGRTLRLLPWPGAPGKAGWLWRPGRHVEAVLPRPRYRGGWFEK